MFVGFVAPLSTAEAVVAEPMRDAVARALAIGDGAERHVELRVADDARDPQRAAAAVAGFAAETGCLGVVGPKNSGSALAAAPIAAAAGLPLALPCATADQLTAERSTVVRLCASDTATAVAAAHLVGELSVRRLAVLADDTDYGARLGAAVTVACRARGIDTTASVGTTAAAFLAMGEVEQAELMQRLRADHYAGTFVSAEGGPDAPVARLAGAAAEGSWLFYPGSAVDGWSVYAAEAYDAVAVLLAAGGDPERARRFVGDGHTGSIAFDTDGNRRGCSVARYRVVDGVVTLVPSDADVRSSG